MQTDTIIPIICTLVCWLIRRKATVQTLSKASISKGNKRKDYFGDQHLAVFWLKLREIKNKIARKAFLRNWRLRVDFKL